MIHVTCAIIFKDAKVLVAQNHATSDHAYQWEFPGGKIQAGETAEECIVREISEELNLQVKVCHALQAVNHAYSSKSIRLIPFVCSVISGELQLNDHRAVKWVKMNELQELDLSGADRRLVEQNENRHYLEKQIGEKMDQP
ncbi:(deoxy)nucleoside triphosphate pyrophosphohydrolase [uncultured Draconibacterium sp.]|uniref:(deoxy)nucleoside triphosphate pyrophosphohydrolase n=1 Tax=uncultured Draconibacterium sp. TaxID=1573823 RepID=UPI003260BE4D